MSKKDMLKKILKVKNWNKIISFTQQVNVGYI